MALPLHTGTLSPPWQVVNDTNRDKVGATWGMVRADTASEYSRDNNPNCCSHLLSRSLCCCRAKYVS